MSLSSLRIIVTRPEPQATSLCQAIEQLGGEAIALPTIAFAPPDMPIAFHPAMRQLGEQDWLIFVSPQTVYQSIVDIRRAWPQFSPSLKLAAIGAGTAKALHAAGYEVAIHPDEWSSEGLLALPAFQAIAKQKITIIRGEGGRELLEKVLTERGAKVTSMIVYKRILPAIEIKPYLELIANKKIDVIVCTSFTGVQNLKRLLGAAAWNSIRSIPLLVVSQRIKMLAQGLGFQTIWVAQNASDQEIISRIKEIIEKRNT